MQAPLSINALLGRSISRSLSIGVFAATLAGVCQQVQAEIVVYPDVFAEVRLVSCQPIEIGPSTLRLSELGYPLYGTSDMHTDDQASKFVGTMVQVQFIEVTQPAGFETSKVKRPGSTWKNGEFAALISAQKPSDACRRGSRVFAITHQHGCDTIPNRGACVVRGLEFVCLNPPKQLLERLKQDPYASSSRNRCMPADGER